MESLKPISAVPWYSVGGDGLLFAVQSLKPISAVPWHSVAGDELLFALQSLKPICAVPWHSFAGDGLLCSAVLAANLALAEASLLYLLRSERIHVLSCANTCFFIDDEKARSIANTLAITLRECVRVRSVRIGRLNYILSLCSRATLLYISKFSTLYTATFPLMDEDTTISKLDTLVPMLVHCRIVLF